MEFFLEMILTAVVALLFSFVVAKVVSVAMAGGGGGGNGSSSESEEKSRGSVGEEAIVEEMKYGQRMDAPVFESEKTVRVVEESVENVDQFSGGFVRDDELDEAVEGTGEVGLEREELPVEVVEAELPAAESPENLISEEMVLQGQEKQSESVVERDDCSKVEERSESKESEDVTIAESGEVRVGEIEFQEENEKKELDIEDDDDDWEGIECSELEKTFAAAAKFVENSGEAIGIGAETKMELYGLHKVATEGSCREPQPMALMVSARAKWNAWQKLGNMSQEEAMERYLALLSKEIPGWMQDNSNGEKKPETKTSVNLHSDPDSESATEEGDTNDASNLDSKAKGDSAI